MSFKILLIGDSCVDEYKICTVDRMSPEAPVAIAKIVDQYRQNGMAANVKDNLEKLGVQVDFVTNTEEITKTRYICKRSGQHMLRVDHDPKITPWHKDNEFSLSGYDAIVISDYDKGLLTYNAIERIIDSVMCPVFIDSKKIDLNRFAGPHVYLKINEVEFQKSDTDSVDNLIVTLGERGAMLIKGGGAGKLFPSHVIDVNDVCGCGDTFLSALAYCYLATISLEESIKFANVAAAITAQHLGTWAPSHDSIMAIYNY